MFCGTLLPKGLLSMLLSNTSAGGEATAHDITPTTALERLEQQFVALRLDVLFKAALWGCMLLETLVCSSRCATD